MPGAGRIQVSVRSAAGRSKIARTSHIADDCQGPCSHVCHANNGQRQSLLSASLRHRSTPIMCDSIVSAASRLTGTRDHGATTAGPEHRSIAVPICRLHAARNWEIVNTKRLTHVGRRSTFVTRDKGQAEPPPSQCTSESDKGEQKIAARACGKPRSSMPAAGKLICIRHPRLRPSVSIRAPSGQCHTSRLYPRDSVFGCSPLWFASSRDIPRSQHGLCII